MHVFGWCSIGREEWRWMQFLLLVYHDEKWWMSLSDALRAAVYEDYRTFVEKITNSGAYREGGELELSSTACTVRIRNGSTETCQVSYNPAREQLAGFFLIDANVLDDAIAIAAQIPAAHGGSIEVRAVLGG